MTKKHVLLLILISISLLGISMNYSDLFYWFKIKYYINVLAKDGTIYIPTVGDQIYYLNPKPENKQYDKNIYANPEKIKVVKALYGLWDITESDISKLLSSSCPNLRVYGYIYYVKKTDDLFFDYLLDSFSNWDIVEYRDEDIYCNCYISDILLLIALKGIDYHPFLPRSMDYRYELTNEQKDILKIAYEKRKSIDNEIDMLIRHYFEYDFTDWFFR